MTSIDPASWGRLSPLLDEVLELDAAGRAARIAALRSENATLADELETLLHDKDDADAASFLDAADSLAATSLSLAGTSLEGTRIGSYVVEALLGQGGSGSVWRARRGDERIGGVVAIKLLHLSMLGHSARPRFEREGAILARLAHPHIARLIDAGVATNGQPYLVLDLVTGQPIDWYCDVHRLDVDQRLALFDDVLAAVAHAHSHLIVHRDIKPGNILVGNDGIVKLLDFGIAKLLEDDADGAVSTAEGHRALTPRYAAPEQVRGLPITTATDIYALGVLLYHLLVGQHPTSSGVTNTGDLIRSTLEVDPIPLTRALAESATRSQAEIAGIATERDTTPERLRRRLRGDLENIVARMLRKDPAERYQTVVALAEDLRRYRANEPVSARPDAIAYRMAKFTRRHRVGVAATVLVVLSLAAGLAGTITQARRAEAHAAQAQRERDNALRQLSYAESSNEFITFLLDQGGWDTPFTMAELMARGEALVTKQFADDPATRARLQMHLSGLYAQGAQSGKAAALLEQAQRGAHGVDDPTLRATIECALAWQASEKGAADVGFRMLDAAIARLHQAQDRETGKSALAECLFGRGQMRFGQGDAQGSLEDLRAALGTLGRPRTDQRTLAIRIRSTLALALNRIGQAAPAIAEYERVVAELEAMGRGRTLMMATLHNNLAVLLNASGQTRRALESSARALDIVRGTGDTDPVLEGVYAKILVQLGRAREALPLAEHAIATASAADNQRIKLTALQNGAVALCGVGSLPRCAALLDEAEALAAKILPAGNTTLASVHVQQGELALARADATAAARLLRHAAAVYGARPEPNANGILALALLSRAEQRLGDLTLAQQHAEQAVAKARQAMAGFEHSRWLGVALVAQGLVQRERRDVESAKASWRAALVELQATEGDAAPSTEEARQLLAGS